MSGLFGIPIEGVDTSVDGLTDHRDAIIELRNAALEQNAFSWAVLLSHNIAILAALISYLKEAELKQ